MAKKKKTLSKLLAFTTAAAAIGGTCYIFKDKIKSCPFCQKVSDIFSGIKDNVSDRFCKDDEFIFDDEDDFEDDFKDVFTDMEHGREYTSITINAKEDSTSSPQNSESTSETSIEQADTAKEECANKDSFDSVLEEVIPTISFGSSLNPSKTTSVETDKEGSVRYENEGLSDVSEDPDILEEQDRLDF